MVAVLQRLDRRAGIDQGATAGVDEHDPALHAPEGSRIDKVLRRRRQGAMKGHDARSGEDIRQRDIFNSQCPAGFVRKRVVGEQPATEAREDARHDQPDIACAHDAHGPAVQIEAEQAFQREVAFPNAGIGAVDLAVERQDESDGMLRDRVRRVGWYARHADPDLGRSGEIDIVEAGTAQGHEARPVARQRGQGLAVQPVVDEGANRLGFAAEQSRLWRQTSFDIR